MEEGKEQEEHFTESPFYDSEELYREREVSTLTPHMRVDEVGEKIFLLIKVLRYAVSHFRTLYIEVKGG